MMVKWKRSFVWFPEVVEDGDPKKFGWRWLCFGWYRWFDGHYDEYWRPATHNWDIEAMKFTGVSGVISAAHYSREGVLHGHTWQVVVWWQADSYMTSADRRKRLLADYLQKFDHSVLPEQLSWGEDLAERIGLDMRAAAVDISRPLEGIYAKWCKE